MKAEIIAVGSELLTPFFTDTNSSWLTGRLEETGVLVSFRTIVGDDEECLRLAAAAALERSDIIIVTGGLGPTEDDRTREVFGRVLGRRLIFEPSIEKNIEDRSARWGLSLPPKTNLKQCWIIDGSEVLFNENGTAPGLWLETGRKALVLLPGPPHEMAPLFDKEVVPRLAAFLGPHRRVYRRTLRLTGIGESAMEEKILPIYSALPKDIAVTTLAKPGDLSITMTASAPLGEEAAVEKRLDVLEESFLAMIGGWVYSRDGRGLEEVVAESLIASGLTVACAESCTGGLLSDRLTSVPGSSAYFLGAVVSYSNEVKAGLLGVPRDILERHGAVSRETAEAMAVSVRSRLGADIGLATTGIAGPGGGSPEKPVGLVFTALADGSGTIVERSFFGGDRWANKSLTVRKSLDMLRRRLASRLPDGTPAAKGGKDE